MRASLGKMTAEETQELLTEIIEEVLTFEQVLEVLQRTLTDDQKAELAAQWGD